MRRFFLLFFSFLTTLQAGIYNDNPTQYVQHDWSGNEQELFLELRLIDEFMFPESYRVSCGPDGQSCTIECTPIEGKTLYTSKSQVVDKIEVQATIFNQESQQSVQFRIETKIYAHSTEGENRATSVSSSEITGNLRNPPVDLSTEPTFFIPNHPDNLGVIAFKNAFGYSELSSQ